MIDKRQPLPTTLVVAGSLILGLGVRIGLDLPREQPNTMWALFLGVLLVISGLVLFLHKQALQRVDTKVQKIADGFGVRSWQVLLLFVSFAFASLAVAGSGFEKRMYSPGPALTSWMLGILSAFVGGYRFHEEKLKISGQTAIFLTSITVIAFLFRGFGTGMVPVILTGDEALAGLNAAEFRSGDWNNIFITSWHSFPSLFSFIQSIFIFFFGQTTEALRVLSAIVGALTVAAVYLYGRAMFGHRAGMLAALSLSAIHYHIHFSRLGLNNIWDGLWYTLAIGSLWYGWEHNKRIGYLISGLALGFSQYFYVSSRGLFALVLVGLVIVFLFQRSRFYQSIPNLVLMFVTSLVVILPLFWFYAHEPHTFFAPMERVSILRVGFNGPIRPIDAGLWNFAVKQILTSAQVYTYVPLQYWYTPDAPILRPIFGTFFCIGLIFLCLRNRDSRFTALVLWLLLFVFIGGLSENALAAQRYVAAAPACALVLGYGLHKIIEFFESLWQKYAKVIVGLSYMVIGVAMLSDLYFYYLEYRGIDLIENVTSHGMIAQQLANRLEDQPEGTQVAFFGVPDLGYYSIPSIQYLAPQVKGIDVPVAWKSFDKTILSSKHIIFVFLPARKHEMEIIKTEYPSGFLAEEKAWNRQTLFWIYDYTAN